MNSVIRLPGVRVDLGVQIMLSEDYPAVKRFISKVTRVEVIDGTGRAYTGKGFKSVELHLQDEGRTLKVFVRLEDNEED